MSQATETHAQSFVYAREPLVALASFPQPERDDFPAREYKYADLEVVRADTTDYVRAVIDAVPLRGEHRYVIVDVKVSELRAEFHPCIPGWHCDVTLDPSHATAPEVHHLLVSGTASLTEFVAEPVELALGDPTRARRFLRGIEDQLAVLDPRVVALESCVLTRYGRWHLHRGSPATHDERRLLVRVTETDLIRPRRTPRR